MKLKVLFAIKNHKYCNYHILVVCLYHILCLYSRSPYSVPKLLIRRQPWLPRGQGWTTAQLCSYWTVYWLTDPAPFAEHYPSDDHPLLQWPFREQAGIQTDLPGWVHVWLKTKGRKPWGITAGASSWKRPLRGCWGNSPFFKLSLLFSFSRFGLGNTSWLLEWFRKQKLCPQMFWKN